MEARVAKTGQDVRIDNPIADEPDFRPAISALQRSSVRSGEATAAASTTLMFLSPSVFPREHA
jgi:hypothetical protein